MHLNLIIVSLIAAATARHIPDDDAPYSVPAPTAFPSRTQHRPSRDANREKPNFDEHGYDHIHANNRRNLEDVPRYFESPNDGTHIKGPIFEDEPKYFHNFGPQNVDTVEKGILKEKQNGDRSSDAFGENEDHRNHKEYTLQPITRIPYNPHMFRNEKDLSKNPEHSDNVNTDNLDNRFNQAPKTNLNSTRSENFPRVNEATPTPYEGRTIENELKGDARARNASEDTDEKWVWSTTTVAPSTGTDLDNRAAFDGGVCPTGKIRIKGTDMCVEKDEDK